MEYQTGIFEAILDLLYLKPLFILGFILTSLLLYWIYKKDRKLPRFKIAISTILLYYYLCIVFNHVVGIPTLNEFFRLASLGEAFFNPNISLVPFADGINLEVVLNIFCFIPLGFLCPGISRAFGKIGNIVFIGFAVSFMIEVSQLFTLDRATDITDLITNVLGTVIGFLCYKLIEKLRRKQRNAKQDISAENHVIRLLPVLAIIISFSISFLIG